MTRPTRSARRRAAGWALQVAGLALVAVSVVNMALALWLGPVPMSLLSQLAYCTGAIIFGVAGAWFGRIIRD